MTRRILYVPFRDPEVTLGNLESIKNDYPKLAAKMSGFKRKLETFKDGRSHDGENAHYGLPGKQMDNGYRNSNERWIASYRAKQTVKEEKGTYYDINQIWYTGEYSRALAGLGNTDVIYVRGHCVPGVDYIYDKSDHDEDGNVVKMGNGHQSANLKYNWFKLSANEVATRIFRDGLSKNFNGTIKCYNCNSAVGVTNFAKSLKDELQARDYANIIVIGYKDKMSTAYDGDHKYGATTVKGAQVRGKDLQQAV